MRALAAALVALASACAATPNAAGGGTLRVFVTDRGVPMPCGRDRPIEVRHGPLPLDAVLVAHAASEAKQLEVGLADHEALMKPLASRLCGDGVSVLQAIEEDGVVTSTTLVVWRRAAEGDDDDTARP